MEGHGKKVTHLIKTYNSIVAAQAPEDEKEYLHLGDFVDADLMPSTKLSQAVRGSYVLARLKGGEILGRVSGHDPDANKYTVSIQHQNKQHQKYS